MKTCLFILLITTSLTAFGQLFKRDSIPQDSTRMNLDAIYSRPFLTANQLPVSIGGYVEAQGSMVSSNGISEGFSFSIPRLTLFFSATPHYRIRFLTEIELEEGGREINIEFASLDVQFHPLLNFRAGVVVNPIGSFNQNHDGPKWDIIERPLVSTALLPATWSTVGAGFFGKWAQRKWTHAYEFYVTNGFDESIVSNATNRTYLAAAKNNAERFTESTNGKPLLTAKYALKNRKFGEVGASMMLGVYNRSVIDGLTVDNDRIMLATACDWDLSVLKGRLRTRGEAAMVQVQLPTNYIENFGRKQVGYYNDLTYLFRKGKMAGFNAAQIFVVLRTEWVDYNLGYFTSSKTRIGDESTKMTIGVSFRPIPSIVLRAGYGLDRTVDLIGNEPIWGGWTNIGIAAYF